MKSETGADSAQTTTSAADEAQPKRAYRKSRRARAEAATGTAILDAALAAFTREPFDRVTLQAVADAAGVTVQTVIRRFGSKEGLFQALAERETPRILAARAVAEGADLSIALDALLAHYEADGDLVLNLLAQETRVEPAAEAVATGRHVHRDWVERHCADLLAGSSGAARQRMLHAAIVATDLGTWKLLRRDLGLPLAEVKAVMMTLLATLQGDT